MTSQDKWIAASNTEFVEKLCQENHITDQRVKQAFLKVDRMTYAPQNAYLHSQEPIGFWAVVNMPYLDALALETTLEYLLPNDTYPRRRVLDVGSGSGYTTNLLAEMVGDQGLVIGIDHFHELRDLGERNMSASDRGRELLARGNVVFVSGDGRGGLSIDQRSDIAGVDDNTKWDVIHVGASARWTVPQELMRQLKSPGCMFIPVTKVKNSKLVHAIWKIEKDELGYETRSFVHDDLSSDLLQHLPDDTEEERNRPGYGVIPGSRR